MEFEWTIADDFLMLAKKINNCLLYAEFAEAPIPNHKAVGAGMKLIMQTGLFKQEYEEWHAKDTNQRTWAHFKEFWPPKVRTKQCTQRSARQFEFGGMSVQEQASMQEGINDFANVHAQKIATVSGLQH